MTSLIVWSGADTHDVPSSLNMATDSRISWSGGQHWDQAKKLYASTTLPILVGFVGDVQFPTLCLPVALDRVDHGLVESPLSAVDSLISAIRSMWREYPGEVGHSQTIVIGYREGLTMTSRFSVTVMRRHAGASSRWATSTMAVAPYSQAILIEGSGSHSVRSAIAEWHESASAGTSRAIYSAFVESVLSGADPHSGGAPQLGSLYRVGSGRLLGVVHQNRRYFSGARLLGDEVTTGVEWRNDLFEIADGRSRRRRVGAQVHAPR